MKKLLLLVLLLSSQFANSTVHIVSSNNDNGPGTLRDAISLAAADDTIDFSISGTISLNSELVISQNLTILSPSSDSITIDGQNQTHLISVTGGDVNIFNIFFQAGSTAAFASGGAIQKSSSGNLRIEKSKFFDCSASVNGGAIVQTAGSMDLIRCYFFNNDANGSGGSIYNGGGTFYLWACTFEESNSGFSGGAISNVGGNMHIVNSTFYNNDAGIDGGATTGDNINMINCTLTNNDANGSGGAVKGGNGYILNCIIYDNTASNGPNVFQPFTSYGYNLLGDTSDIGSIDSTDIFGPDPLLQPISLSNGGVTPSCAIQSGSPCIDAGGCVSAPGYDQRDSTRIGIPDIGSFEFGGVPFAMTFVSDSMCVGDTIFFDNDTIVAPSVTTHIMDNVQGCDSVIELTVTFITPDSTTYFGTDSMCMGDTLFFGNDTILSAGVSTHILSNFAGCDSIVEITVTYIQPDTAVTHVGDTITASSLASSWQWYDCNSMSILPNETAQVFIATSNGLYAAIVTQNGCVDTSACVFVSTVGTENLYKQHAIVYPTVVKDYVTIRFESNDDVTLQLLNVTGKVVLSEDLKDRKNYMLDMIDQKPGIYFLRILGDGINSVTKLIKE